LERKIKRGLIFGLAIGWVLIGSAADHGKDSQNTSLTRPPPDPKSIRYSLTDGVICSYQGTSQWQTPLCDSAAKLLKDYGLRFEVDVEAYIKEDPIPLRVKPSGSCYGGETRFTINRDKQTVRCREMVLEAGTCEGATGALRHELSHYVFTHYLINTALPHWADEGLAILQEDSREIERVERAACTPREVDLNHLFNLVEYPEGDIFHFYGQSALLVQYFLAILGSDSRHPGMKPEARFLRFIRDSPQGWEVAIKKHFPQFKNIAQLQSWFQTYVDRQCARLQGPK